MNNTITLSEDEALKLYNSSDANGKRLLEEKGIGFNTWITLFDEFCKENNLTIKLPHENPSNPEEENDNANRMIKEIIKFNNKGWRPDIMKQEKRWFPVFDVTASGFVFSYSAFDFSDTYAYVGSRLCSRTEEDSTRIAKKYLKIYEKLIVH